MAYNIGRSIGSGAVFAGKLTTELGKILFGLWRAKKAFETALRDMGIPDDVVDALSDEFPKPKSFVKTTFKGD